MGAACLLSVGRGEQKISRQANKSVLVEYISQGTANKCRQFIGGCISFLVQ